MEEVLVADSKTCVYRMVASYCARSLRYKAGAAEYLLMSALRTLTRLRAGATGDAEVVLVQGARRES